MKFFLNHRKNIPAQKPKKQQPKNFFTTPLSKRAAKVNIFRFLPNFFLKILKEIKKGAHDELLK